MKKVLMKNIYKVYIPKRIRAPLDSEDITNTIQQKILKFRKSLIRAVSIATGTDATAIISFEYKSFGRTDTTVGEIRCRDQVIGLVYSSRTEFNHQEVIFISCLDDAMPRIKKEIREIKKFLK
jgi:hypothetical protein